MTPAAWHHTLGFVRVLGAPQHHARTVRVKVGWQGQELCVSTRSLTPRDAAARELLERVPLPINHLNPAQAVAA